MFNLQPPQLPNFHLTFNQSGNNFSTQSSNFTKKVVTPQLTLRHTLGRKLTIEEMDNNFIYLDTKGGGGLTGSPGGVSVFDSNGNPTEFISMTNSFIRTDGTLFNYFQNPTFSIINLSNTDPLFPIGGIGSVNILNWVDSKYGNQQTLSGNVDMRFLDNNVPEGSIAFVSGWQDQWGTSSTIFVNGRTDFLTLTHSYGILSQYQSITGTNPNCINYIGDLSGFIGTTSSGLWVNSSTTYTTNSLFVQSDFNSLNFNDNQLNVRGGILMSGSFSKVPGVQTYLQGRGGIVIAANDVLDIGAQNIIINGSQSFSGTFSTSDPKVIEIKNGLIVSVN